MLCGVKRKITSVIGIPKEITARFYLKAQQKAADYFSEKIQSVQCCNPQDVQVMIKGIDDY